MLDNYWLPPPKTNKYKIYILKGGNLTQEILRFKKPLKSLMTGAN